jgi:hypothetical protein
MSRGFAVESASLTIVGGGRDRSQLWAIVHSPLKNIVLLAGSLSMEVVTPPPF